MSGPAPEHPAAAPSFDEVEAQLKARADAAKKPKPEDVKIEGEGVPDALQGKTVQDLLTQMQGLSEAVKISEKGREDLKEELTITKAQMAAAASHAPEAPKEPEVKPPTAEELQKLYEENPLAAMQELMKGTEKRLQDNLDARLTPLATGNAAEAETRAREKYAEDFELFGDQIEAVLAKSVPDRSVLTNSKHWDDLVAYVRGQPGNVDKLIEHRSKKAADTQAADAQAAQAAAVPYSGTEAAKRPPPPKAKTELDDTQKDIIRVFQQSGLLPEEGADEEYRRWEGVG